MKNASVGAVVGKRHVGTTLQFWYDLKVHVRMGERQTNGGVVGGSGRRAASPAIRPAETGKELVCL